MTPARRHDTGQRDNLRATAAISTLLAKCCKGSAAGPDQIPYGVWNGLRSVNHRIIQILVDKMLEWEIHPPMLEESIRVIVAKPNKVDYTDCTSFRVINLMQKVSKIAERVVAGPLTSIIYSEGLYSIKQTGSLLKRSTVDTAISLQHGIKESQFTKKKVSSIFLDMKGVWRIYAPETLRQGGRYRKDPRIPN